MFDHTVVLSNQMLILLYVFNETLPNYIHLFDCPEPLHIFFQLIFIESFLMLEVNYQFLQNIITKIQNKLQKINVSINCLKIIVDFFCQLQYCLRICIDRTNLKGMQLQPQITPQSAQHFNALINQFLNFNSSKSQNKNQVKQIQNRLKLFSKSDLFFQISFDFLINKPDATFEQLFIVSLLLRDKFRYEFDKYSDQQSICYLQNMLKQILRKYNQLPPDIFTTNICVCIICLYIKRSEQLKQQFKEVGILQYYKSFVLGNICSDYFYKALQYTPEEIYSSKIVMDQVKKERVRILVKYSQYQVLNHLNSVAADLWEKKIIKKCHLFAALQNWISVGYKETLFHELPNHFLVQKLFQSCLDASVSTQATDCLKVIIKRIKKSKKDQALFSFLGNGIFKLVDQIRKHIKQFGQSSQINEAIQVVIDFGVIATQFFVENYNPDVKKFLQSTIQFIRIQDLEVYPNLLDFWQGFIDQIHKSNALSNEYVQLLKNVFASVCFRTVWKFQMIQKMNQIPQKNLGKFYDQAQNILQRRDQSSGLFQSLALTFGQQNYLDFVLGCISHLSKNQPQLFWPYLQCYLNSLKNAIRNFPSISESVKIIVSSYNQIENLVVIKIAYMNVFNGLMTIQQSNAQIKAQFIQHIFSVIASNLNDPKIEQKAQRAFSKGCEQNPQIVINYIQNFISLLKQHEGNQQIVKGIMHVLSSKFEIMQKYLPHVLQVLLQVFTAANSNSKKKLAYHSLYALFKILMRYKNQQHFRDILVDFTRTIWPLILNSLKQPKDIILDQDPEIQRAVKLVKFIMRCLREAFIPFLQSLFTTVFDAYQKYPICSYIYALQVSITVYYEDASLNDYIRTLYQNFCQITYAHLKSRDKIQDYQLLIQDFIGMNKRFFIYNSQIVLQSGQLPSLIQTCINLSNITDVPQVSKAAYQFFQTIFMVYWSDDFISKYNENEYGDKFQKNISNQHLYHQLKSFIIPKLPQIIVKMLNHLQKVPLQSTAQCILDALMSEIKGFSQVNQQMWTPILQGIPRQILTNSQKADIYDNLFKVGSVDIQQSREAASIIDRLIYIMNKRFINNYKRRL